jgi:hypothetical protein
MFVRRIALVVIIAAGDLIFHPGLAQTGSETAKLLEKENIVDVAKPGGGWSPASVGQTLVIQDRLRTGEESRATVRLSDLSVLHLDELTTIEILPAKETSAKATLNVKQGSTYFFSREKSREVQFQTPGANGAIRGTEFLLFVARSGRTFATMLAGKLELSNAKGSLLARGGEQARAEPGAKQTKGAISSAIDIAPYRLLIERKLPPHKTLLTANKAELLTAVCDTGKQWRIVAPQIVKTATMARKEYGDDILSTANRCLGPEGRPEKRGEGEGDYMGPPPNINPPPGLVGTGLGQNVCLVCHNGREIQIPCDQVQRYLKQHQGDFAGPCEITPVTNP